VADNPNRDREEAVGVAPASLLVDGLQERGFSESFATTNQPM
jgi:hypothetical protein